MLEAPFDPVKLAIPFFILAILLEIGLSRLRLAKAEYEARDTGPPWPWACCVGFPPS